MKDFQSLFREYLARRNITVYRLSKALQIERSTLYQVQNGTRLPTPQVLQRMAAQLHLTAQEEQAWLEAWKREKMGEESYRLRRCIEQCIRALAQYGRPAPPLQVRRRVTLEAAGPGAVRIQGRGEVTRLVCDLIVAQQGRGARRMDMNLPPHALELYGSALRDMPADAGELRVRQLFPLLPPDEARQEDVAAWLEVLLCVLRGMFSPVRAGRFEPYYYYDPAANSEDLTNLFPYYIIADEYVVMLSKGQEDAVLLTDRALIDAARLQFDAALPHARPLVHRFDSVLSAFERIGPVDSPEADGNVLGHYGWQPCLTVLIDREILEHGIRPDCPFRGQVVESALEYYMDMACGGPTYNFFTRRGLETFMQDGILREHPAAVVRALPMTDRVTLLRRLREKADDESWNMHCLDENAVCVPENATLSLCFGRRLLFSGNMSQQLDYLVLDEQTIVNSFLEYFRALPQLPGVAGRGETAAMLDELLQKYAG